MVSAPVVLPPLPPPRLPVSEPITAVLAPAASAARTYGGAVLGDARRTERLVRTMTAIAAQPTASLPRQWRSSAAVKATYRLLPEPDVTGEALLGPHRAATRTAAAAAPVVLFVQDQTQLDYSAHPATRGLLLHTALAVLPATGTVLGLAGPDVFLSILAPRPGERTAERQGRPRESEAWDRLVAQIGAPPDRCWVHVGDRGSDAVTFFAAIQTVFRLVLKPYTTSG